MKLTAKELSGIFHAFKNGIAENKELLIKLDSVAGDGDLGLSMLDGFTAVAASLDASSETDIGKLLYLASKIFNNSAPSTTGTLMANGFMCSAKQLKGRQDIDLEGIKIMVHCWLDGIMNLGKAKRNEKTIIDALAPAVDSLEAETKDADIKEAVKRAANAAKLGAENTTNMMAVHGRAAIRKEDSIGMIDPGAVMMGILMESMANYICKL